MTILFYALTNMYILNAVNVKTNYFPDEDADLYIVESSRISPTMVDSILKMNIFRKVAYLPPVLPNSAPKIIWNNLFLRRVYRIIAGIKSIHRINYIIKKTIPDSGYSKACFNHLNDGYGYLTLLNFVMKYNSNVQPSLIEEGAGDLYRDELKTFGYYNETKWADYIINHITRWKINRESVIENINETYLYMPKYYSPYKKEIKRKIEITKIDSKNKIVNKLIKSEIYNIDIVEYKRRRYYYLTSADELDHNYSNMYQQINCILHSIPQDKLIIKDHPRSFDNTNDIYSQYRQTKIYIDERNYLFESIYSAIDLDDKVFITHKSATALHPKYMFGKEPYVIFTFNINNNRDYFDERVILDLKSEYTNKNKILVPRTNEELEIMLENIEKYQLNKEIC